MHFQSGVSDVIVYIKGNNFLFLGKKMHRKIIFVTLLLRMLC